MLQPRKQKYRKQFRGTLTGIATTGNQVSFGDFGLKALEGSWITSRQIEAARRAIVHFTKRAGKTWIRIFPDKPITHKPVGVRMGGGKGDIETYVAVVRPGKIMFEVGGIPDAAAIEALTRAGHKLPILTKVLRKA